MAAGATALTVGFLPAAHAGHVDKSATVGLSVTPSSATVEATPCGEAVFQLAMTNSRDRPIYTDVYITADAGLDLRQPVLSTYIPANTTVTDSVSAFPAAGASPGRYQVRMDAGKKPVEIPITVVRPEAGHDLARTATPTASSSHGGFMPCGAVDGDINQADWGARAGMTKPRVSSLIGTRSPSPKPRLSRKSM